MTGTGYFSEHNILPGSTINSSFVFLFTFNNISACCPGLIKLTLLPLIAIVFIFSLFPEGNIIYSLFVVIIPESNLP